MKAGNIRAAAAQYLIPGLSHICLAIFLFLLLLPVNLCHADSGTGSSVQSHEIAAAKTVDKPDIYFLVSVENIARRWEKKKGEMVLVDVRSQDKFNKIRIRDSLNIPLFALRTKTFLKNRKMVIFNEGYTLRELLSECRKLEESGFHDVHVMYGGLWLWHQKGKPLEGDVFAIEELNIISPHDLFVQQNLDGQLVVDISEQPCAPDLHFPPGTVRVPYSGNDDTFIQAIRQKIRPIEKIRFCTVVICNRHGRYPAKINSIMKKAGTLNFYLLKNGIEGYDSFIVSQQKIHRKNMHKKVIRKCPTCP